MGTAMGTPTLPLPLFSRLLLRLLLGWLPPLLPLLVASWQQTHQSTNSRCEQHAITCLRAPFTSQEVQSHRKRKVRVGNYKGVDIVHALMPGRVLRRFLGSFRTSSDGNMTLFQLQPLTQRRTPSLHFVKTKPKYPGYQRPIMST